MDADRRRARMTVRFRSNLIGDVLLQRGLAAIAGLGKTVLLKPLHRGWPGNYVPVWKLAPDGWDDPLRRGCRDRCLGIQFRDVLSRTGGPRVAPDRVS